MARPHSSGDSAGNIKGMGGKKMADDNSYVYICLYEFIIHIYIGRIQHGEKEGYVTWCVYVCTCASYFKLRACS